MKAPVSHVNAAIPTPRRGVRDGRQFRAPATRCVRLWRTYLNIAPDRLSIPAPGRAAPSGEIICDAFGKFHAGCRALREPTIAINGCFSTSSLPRSATTGGVVDHLQARWIVGLAEHEILDADRARHFQCITAVTPSCVAHRGRELGTPCRPVPKLANASASAAGVKLAA